MVVPQPTIQQRVMNIQEKCTKTAAIGNDLISVASSKARTGA